MREKTKKIADEVTREMGGEPRGLLSRGGRHSQSDMERRLALLQKLEASLLSSHRALLSLDLAAIEQGTRGQLTLCENLALDIRQNQNATDRGRRLHSERLQELRRSEWKVLHAARLQAALLRRAQLKLHVMANTLAGLERNYAGPEAWRNRLRTSLLAENRG